MRRIVNFAIDHARLKADVAKALSKAVKRLGER